MKHRRYTRIVTGVVREALRVTSRNAAVVSGGGPEQALLEAWLEEAGIPFQTPTGPEVDLGARLMEAGGRGPGPHRSEASSLAGLALAWREDLLLLGTENKTGLLLSPRRPIQPVLPLGDVYASQVWDLAGSATLPPVLAGCPLEVVREVDQALESYYAGTAPVDAAFDNFLPTLRGELREAWALARKGWHPGPLIPKLGRTTLGLDLDP